MKTSSILIGGGVALVVLLLLKSKASGDKAAANFWAVTPAYDPMTTGSAAAWQQGWNRMLSGYMADTMPSLDPTSSLPRTIGAAITSLEVQP